MRASSLTEISKIFESAAAENLVRYGGIVRSVAPTRVVVAGLAACVGIGDLVSLKEDVLAEVIEVNGSQTVVFPFCDVAQLRVGDPVFTVDEPDNIPSEEWFGRVFDALGNPIDDLPQPRSDKRELTAPTRNKRPGALQRSRVQEPLKTGVKVIDIFAPLCFGQRLGIFAGSGVGKSTLLSMLARSEAFDVVVVALVGERSREVREFLEDSLGEVGRQKTIAVVATSDQSSVLRKRAPEFALGVCEHFSREGKKVLLLMDSITRYAHALREVGVSRNEPPIARGYPSSAFAELPKLLERAGPGSEGNGSITAITTVLVDGDDHNDPVADTVRGIIDGHLVLDRSIAEQGRYPPINPLSSLSRLSNKVWTDDEKTLVLQLRQMISRFEDTRDLRMLGGWRSGNDAGLDKAVETVPLLYEALCQSPAASLSNNAFEDLVSHLKGSHEAKQEKSGNPGRVAQS